ncbi:hypothetical protein [Leptolyngbya sp. 'hensonii']|uniref:hypothetical protein n=1 Tax=Leptolyngbya sp. 'hensonii' TaxID=1922337 RepID=UPI0009F95EB7|nr:hypothetical protein [Leptolyngbya sp. 'hensonii']
MLGELPCLEATEACIKSLQEMAVQKSQALQAIDSRIEVINSKIEEARANNQKTIALGVFEPLVQSWLKLETVTSSTGQQQQRGFLENVLDVFTTPLQGVNEVLSLIGLPLFRNAIGGDAAAQQRTIAIADLQVKVAEVERQRGELAAKIREQVLLQALDFDQTRREFQVSQEVARREALRLKLITVDYRFGFGDTNGYLQSLSAMDKQKAQTFRDWAKLRRQLTQIKLLVLGAD